MVAHTGTPWIDLVRPSEFLSRQDLLELRVLYTESLSDRQTSATASKDFNVSAREECAQKGLTLANWPYTWGGLSELCGAGC